MHVDDARRSAAAYMVETERDLRESESLQGPRWEEMGAHAACNGVAILLSMSDHEDDDPDPTRRIGLNWVLRSVHAGRYDTLLVYRLADLGYSLRDLSRIWSSVFAGGRASLLTVEEGIDTRDETAAWHFSTLLGAMHGLRSAGASKRVRRGLARRKRAGQRLGGALPYGFRLAEDGQMLEENPIEQAQIARIGEMRERGMSIRGIADLLNGEGVPARGRRWHPTTVARLLRR